MINDRNDDFRDMMPDSRELYESWTYGPFEISYDSDGKEIWNEDKEN